VLLIAIITIITKYILHYCVWLILIRYLPSRSIHISFISSSVYHFFYQLIQDSVFNVCYYWLLVTVKGWYRSKCPMYYDNFLIYCAPHLSSNHSWFIHKNSLAAAETLSSVAEIWREMSLTLANVVSLLYSADILNIPRSLTTWVDGFIPPSSDQVKVCCRFLLPLKIHRPRPNLKPRA
jgi:hypothetical protein